MMQDRWEAYGRLTGVSVQLAWFYTKTDCGVIMVNGEVQNKVPKERHQGK